MSTKIYNAYKFILDKDEIIPYLKVLKGKSLGVIKERFKTHEHFIKCKFKDCKNFSDIEDKYLELKRSMFKNPPFDYCSASTIVYFHKNQIYLQFFNIPIDLDKEKKLIDFHYQNQTDPPEDIDYEEFEKRGKIWDEILKDLGIPSKEGLTYEYFSGFPEDEEFCKCIYNIINGKPDQ